MKDELKKIENYLEDAKVLTSDQQEEVTKLLNHADKHLIDKAHHDATALKLKRSNRGFLYSLVFFIAGSLVSGVSIYFYYHDKHLKEVAVDNLMEIISDLVDKKSYQAARELIEKAEKIDPLNPKLKMATLRVDLSEVLNVGKPITKKLFDECEAVLKQDSESLWLNNNLSVLYQKNGQMVKAMNQMKKTILLSEKLHSYENVLAGTLNLAIFYMESGNLDSAKIYFASAKKLLSKENKPRIHWGLPTKETYLFNYARLFYFRGKADTINYLMDRDSCLFYLDQTIKLEKITHSSSAGPRLQKATALQDLSGPEFFKYKDDIELAFNEAIDEFNNDGDYVGLALAKGSLGKFYSQLGQCDKSKSVFDDAILTAKQSGYDNAKARALGLASQSLFSCKNYKEAFIYNQIALKLVKNMNAPSLIETAKNDSTKFVKFVAPKDLPLILRKSEEETIKLGIR